MEINELYLKTLFCCSVCDGEIAPEEVSLVKELSEKDGIFRELDVEAVLNGYVQQINEKGNAFLKDYLNQVSNATLSEEEQVKIVELAIKMIEADNQILYSEVKFFKKIRNRLSVSDESILDNNPGAEDYLLPDISSEDKDFENIGNFDLISFAEVNKE